VIGTCAAFIVAALAIGMTARSFFGTSRWRPYARENLAIFVSSRGGVLHVWSQELHFTPATPTGCRIDVGQPDTVAVVMPGGMVYPAHTRFGAGEAEHAVLGVGWIYRRLAGGLAWDIDGSRYGFEGRMIAVQAPWVLVALIACLPAAVIVVVSRRRAMRVIGGKCLNCGYDMRATPERCPECGAVASAETR
jgi:hypothetical protein